jgi:endonuclease/exonuclease/phosphatase family metal-dependent hydrolase
MNRLLQTLFHLVVAALVLSLAMPADAANNKKPRKAQIKVMSYNLYLGADIYRVFDPPLCGVPQAVNDIHNIIRQTDFPERAEAIADQVMAQEPHVIGLQEVSLLRTQFPGNSLAPDGSGIVFLGDFPTDPRFTFKTDADHVEYDFLQILLDALEARGLHYVAVEGATATNADVEFPAIEFNESCAPQGLPTDVRLADRDVMLVRAGLEVQMSMADNFMAYFPIELPTFIPTPVGLAPALYVADFTRGWGWIDVTVKDQSYRVVNAHLEVGDRDTPPDVGLNLVQFFQAFELGTIATSLDAPVIVMGDMNSSPASPYPDPRPAYDVLRQFHLVDLWTVRHDLSDDYGFTYGQNELVNNEESLMFERIDHVLGNFGDYQTDKIKVEVVGDEPYDKTPSGLWPSDHAGVAAKISFEQSKPGKGH